jgi:hypothetical protein
MNETDARKEKGIGTARYSHYPAPVDNKEISISTSMIAGR